jgi:hypothetical protein
MLPNLGGNRDDEWDTKLAGLSGQPQQIELDEQRIRSSVAPGAHWEIGEGRPAFPSPLTSLTSIVCISILGIAEDTQGRDGGFTHAVCLFLSFLTSCFCVIWSFVVLFSHREKQGRLTGPLSSGVGSLVSLRGTPVPLSLSNPYRG